MRILNVGPRFRAALRALDTREERAVLAVLHELEDPRTALPRPGDRAVQIEEVPVLALLRPR